MPTVTIRDAGDLKRLNRQLRDLEDGKELRRELTSGLRGVVNPIRDQMKAAYRSRPTQDDRGRPGPSLRSLLAKATKTEVRTTGKLAGVRIRVDGRKMPDRMKSLPSMWEGPPQGKRWRHPVYGNREVWVAQQSHPTFYRIAEPLEADARRAIDEVLDGVRRKLEAGR